jgi:hypothetical protein
MKNDCLTAALAVLDEPPPNPPARKIPAASRAPGPAAGSLVSSSFVRSSEQSAVCKST